MKPTVTVLEQQGLTQALRPKMGDYGMLLSQNEARWNPKGAVPATAQIELRILWRYDVPQDAKDTAELALEAFLLLGSLGLRSTRGLGCFETAERPFTQESFDSLVSRVKARASGFIAHMGSFQGKQDELLEGLGAQLRGLRVGYSAGRAGRPNATPLGSSNPRQASAVYLRPVRMSSDDFRIVVFEAPADKVLGRESRLGAPRLHDGAPPPLDAPVFRPEGYRGRRR